MTCSDCRAVLTSPKGVTLVVCPFCQTDNTEVVDDSLDAENLFQIGEKYRYGSEVSLDYEKSAEYYFKAAQQGHILAQVNLGFMYENGLGVAQDYMQAVEWYRKASEQGDSFGQNNLGTMYRWGLGVAQDYMQAIEWYHKASEQGNVYAQNNLGVMYECGEGVSIDYEKASEWYHKAAKQGVFEAHLGLIRVQNIQDFSKVKIPYDIVLCSFCSKPQSHVDTIIAGMGVWICNECINSCVRVLEENAKKQQLESLPPESTSKKKWWQIF